MVEVPYTYIRTYTYFFISVNVALSFFFCFMEHSPRDGYRLLYLLETTYYRSYFVPFSRPSRAAGIEPSVSQADESGSRTKVCSREIIRDIDEARSKEAENRIPWEREFGNLDWLRARDN